MAARDLECSGGPIETLLIVRSNRLGPNPYWDTSIGRKAHLKGLAGFPNAPMGGSQPSVVLTVWLLVIWQFLICFVNRN